MDLRYWEEGGSVYRSLGELGVVLGPNKHFDDVRPECMRSKTEGGLIKH